MKEEDIPEQMEPMLPDVVLPAGALRAAPLVSRAKAPAARSGPPEVTSGTDHFAEVNRYAGTPDSNDEYSSPVSDLSTAAVAKEDHRPPLLAFAGDRVSLGMMVHDAAGPGLMEAVVLFLPEPVYPLLSRRRGEEGRVVVEVTISARGEVSGVHVKNSSSHPRLDKAALEALKSAVFKPGTEDGRPVESQLDVAYRFELE